MTPNSSLCLSNCIHCCQLHLLYKPHQNLDNELVTRQTHPCLQEVMMVEKGDILLALLSVEQLLV